MNTFDEFHRSRALFSWLILTRPETACTANRSAQIATETLSVDKLKELDKDIAQVRKTPICEIVFCLLHRRSVHLPGDADAPYSIKDDQSSQIDFVILLSDASDSCHIADYSSQKSRCVVRSIMVGETCAFLDAFDAARAFPANLRTALGIKLKISANTDSRQLFDEIERSKRTT